MLIFLDLETTGLESSDKICSIAVICKDENQTLFEYELVNDGKKISPKASSINHITNDMIKDKRPFKESKIFAILEKYNDKNTILVTHNVKFDLKMLSSSGLQWHGKFIDTLRCTKHLIPECETFSLQFLRYELKLYKKESNEAWNSFGLKEVIAHSAVGDVVVLKLLYEYLLELSTKERLLELSLQNVLIEKFEFGKYSGRYIEEISMYDRGYLEWMQKNITDMDDDLIYTINRYLKK